MSNRARSSWQAEDENNEDEVQPLMGRVEQEEEPQPAAPSLDDVFHRRRSVRDVTTFNQNLDAFGNPIRPQPEGISIAELPGRGDPAGRLEWHRRRAEELKRIEREKAEAERRDLQRAEYRMEEEAQARAAAQARDAQAEANAAAAAAAAAGPIFTDVHRLPNYEGDDAVEYALRARDHLEF